MYIMNGIVYGGEPVTSVEISSVKVLDDMIMLVSFSTGETRLFDATILQGEVFEPLKREEIFKKKNKTGYKNQGFKKHNH